MRGVLRAVPKNQSMLRAEWKIQICESVSYWASQVIC